MMKMDGLNALVAIIFNSIYMKNKNELVKTLYYNQPIYNVFNEANQDNNVITSNYVQEWCTTFNTSKAQLPGYTSFIAPYPYYEYQIDLIVGQTSQSQILGWHVLIYSKNTL